MPAEFNANLLREKFIITDVMPAGGRIAAPVIALSNRLAIPLRTPAGDVVEETFIVRAQNMHTCARLAAQVAREFQENGPIIGRRKPVDWEFVYLSITKGYEKKWNPHRWVAVYHKGRPVFQHGEANRHPFLDIIEQCDARNKGDYDKAVTVAEDAFKQAGKTVVIEHDSNVALVLNISDDEGRCGVIVRGPNRTTTFNFTAHKKAGRDVKVSQCLSTAAAFLEGIQLAFLVGMVRQKLRYELISTASEEARQGDEASQKLGRLNGAVTQFENLFKVTYRPERPNFAEMIEDAESFARKILSAQIEQKIASGAGEGKDWIV